MNGRHYVNIWYYTQHIWKRKSDMVALYSLLVIYKLCKLAKMYLNISAKSSVSFTSKEWKLSEIWAFNDLHPSRPKLQKGLTRSPYPHSLWRSLENHNCSFYYFKGLPCVMILGPIVKLSTDAFAINRVKRRFLLDVSNWRRHKTRL